MAILYLRSKSYGSLPFRDDGVLGGHGQVAPRGPSRQAALSPIGPELVSLAPGFRVQSSRGDKVHLRSKHDHPLNSECPPGSPGGNFPEAGRIVKGSFGRGIGPAIP